jgi:hypothetical protein
MSVEIEVILNGVTHVVGVPAQASGASLLEAVRTALQARQVSVPDALGVFGDDFDVVPSDAAAQVLQVGLPSVILMNER